jgi:ribosomal protein S18 acetylase RimI-like enzyme
MKEKYSIKEMKMEDIPIVVKLVRESFDNKYLIPSIYRAKGVAKFIFNELENKFTPCKYFVFWDGDQIVGFSEFKIHNSEIVFLNIIAVSNEYKNKGIGRQLLENSRKYFIDQGFKSIQLDVYKSNTIAITWYSKCGFKHESSNMFYKIKLKPNSRIASKGFYIRNYSQFKAISEFFGFYFVDVGIGPSNLKFGFIDNDLFWRGNYDCNIIEQLPDFVEILKIQNVYFIGNRLNIIESELIDEIIRMELNI